MDPNLQRASTSVSSKEIMPGIPTTVNSGVIIANAAYLIVNLILLFRAKLTASCTSLTVEALTTYAGNEVSLH